MVASNAEVKARLIKEIFHDEFGRPRRKPVQASQLRVLLEREFHYWRVDSALKALVAEEAIVWVEHIKNWQKRGHNEDTPKRRVMDFYYPSEIADGLGNGALLSTHIENAAKLFYQYSSLSLALGEHLEGLVKYELRVAGFDIMKEHAREYREKKLTGREDIDIIARHRSSGLEIGVEVKNRLKVIQRNEVEKTLDICEFFGLVPVFAARWIQPHIDLIRKRGGRAWEFGIQIYPPGFEGLVEKVKGRFSIGWDETARKYHYPMPLDVRTELPPGSGATLVRELGI